MLTVKPLKLSDSAMVGLLKQPAGEAATVEDMNRAAGSYLTAKHDRIRRESGSAPAKRRNKEG